MNNDNCPPNCANCLHEELTDQEEVVEPLEEEIEDGDSLFVSEEE